VTDDPAGRTKPEPELELPKVFRRNRRSGTAPEPAQGQETSAPEPEAARPPEAARAPEATRPPDATDDQASGPEPEEAVEAEEAEQTNSEVRPALPQLPEWAATLVTGLVVGVFGAVLTDLGLRGCQAWHGTSSCGGTGVLMLVVIVLLMGFLGGFLLRLWQVGDARATSFIGVALICVVVLVALMNVVLSPWMFLVAPLVGAAAYLAADWVTTRFVQPADEGPRHDVR
jgi:hypothetical protein